MYICQFCHKEFKDEDEELAAKHLMECWKEQHPYHRSTPAPQGNEVITANKNVEMENFFGALGVYYD